MVDEIIEPFISETQSVEEYIHTPCWRVKLSDGRFVFSRHGRRSWLELKAWLEQNAPIHIVGLWFSFRDHSVCVAEGPKDYFFVNALKAEYGTDANQYYYIGGYRDGDVVRSYKYIIPEIYLLEEEIRPLDDPSVQRGLIKKNEII